MLQRLTLALSSGEHSPQVAKAETGFWKTSFEHVVSMPPIEHCRAHLSMPEDETELHKMNFKSASARTERAGLVRKLTPPVYLAHPLLTK